MHKTAGLLQQLAHDFKSGVGAVGNYAAENTDVLRNAGASALAAGLLGASIAGRGNRLKGAGIGALAGAAAGGYATDTSKRLGALQSAAANAGDRTWLLERFAGNIAETLHDLGEKHDLLQTQVDNAKNVMDDRNDRLWTALEKIRQSIKK